MTSFITIHSNSNGPSFTTFDSVLAAKNHLQSLILNSQVNRFDTLAIVRSTDDQIIYFRQRNNTIASLNAVLGLAQNDQLPTPQSVLQVLKERLTFVFTALSNAVIGR